MNDNGRGFRVGNPHPVTVAFQQIPDLGHFPVPLPLIDLVDVRVGIAQGMGLAVKFRGNAVGGEHAFNETANVIAFHFIDRDGVNGLPDGQKMTVQVIIQHFQEQGFFIFKIGIKTADGDAGFFRDFPGVGAVNPFFRIQGKGSSDDAVFGFNAARLFWGSDGGHLGSLWFLLY